MKQKFKREDPQEQFEDFYDEEDILKSNFEIEDMKPQEYRKVRDILGVDKVIPAHKLNADSSIIELEKLQEKLSLHKMMVDVPLNLPLKEVYRYITEIILEEEVPVGYEDWIVFEALLDEDFETGFSEKEDNDYKELEF